MSLLVLRYGLLLQAEVLKILTNREVIALNQDRRVSRGKLIYQAHIMTVMAVIPVDYMR